MKRGTRGPRMELHPHTREGQKVLATIIFLFTWVHLYKGGSVYIRYEHFFFILGNIDSIARLVAMRHQHRNNALWKL